MSKSNGHFLISWANVNGDIERGPLAVLWELIKRQQVDIFKVSLIKITDDFINFLQIYQIDNVRILSEFIALASRLLQAKSLALLPTSPTILEDDVITLPKEIIEKLLEYRLYQKQTIFLRSQESLGHGVLVPQMSISESTGSEMLELEGLVAAYLKVHQTSQRKMNLPDLMKFEAEQYTVQGKMEDVLRILDRCHKKIEFLECLTTYERQSRIAIVALFLGLLELTRIGKIFIHQEKFNKPIFIETRK